MRDCTLVSVCGKSARAKNVMFRPSPSQLPTTMSPTRMRRHNTSSTWLGFSLQPNKRPRVCDVNLSSPLPKRPDWATRAGCCRFPDREPGSVTRVTPRQVTARQVTARQVTAREASSVNVKDRYHKTKRQELWIPGGVTLVLGKLRGGAGRRSNGKCRVHLEFCS